MRPQTRKGEPAALDREDKAGAQLPHGCAGIHQDGGVPQEIETHKRCEEGFLSLCCCPGAAIGQFGPSNVTGHTLEEFLRRFNNLSAGIASQITYLKNVPGILC